MDLKNINDYTKILNNNVKNITNKPKLVDGGVKYFFKNMLKECNKYKQNNYNNIYNITMLLLFIIVLGSILFFKYKGNKSKEEIQKKNNKDKNYIMSKLVYYNRHHIENDQKIKNNMITNLPDYNNSHPEASLLHKKIYF